MPDTIMELSRTDEPDYVTHFTARERKVRPFVTKSPSRFIPDPNKPYLIKGLLAPGKFGMIYGKPGSGKSIIGPYIGHRVAQGWSEEGQNFIFKRRIQTSSMDVLYISGEDVSGMEERLLGLSNAYGPAERLHFLGGNFDFWADSNTDFDRLIATVANIRPSLIFVDTIASVFPGMDENSGGDMGRMFQKLRYVMDICNSSLIGIHHSPKVGDTPRGHGSLEGTLELSMFIKREGNLVSANIIKNKQGPSGGVISFAIGMAHLGYDADNEAMLAPICEEADATPLILKRLKAESSIAYNILCDMLAGDNAKVTPKEDGFPGIRLYCVSGPEWRAECVRRMLTSSDDAKVQNRAFDAAFRELRAAKLIGACNGLVWSSRGEAVRD